MAGARVAGLATLNPSGAIDLVPFTFAPAGDEILVSAVDHKPKRTPRLQRLANIRANPSVTVLADHYDEDWSTLWWVRARGEATVVEEPAEALLLPLVRKYEQYRRRPPSGPLILITVTDILGWSAGG